MATGLVLDEHYLWHDTANGWILPTDGTTLQPFDHPENPQTNRRFMNLLRASGLLDELVPVAPRSATVDEVLRGSHAPLHMAGLVQPRSRAAACNSANGIACGDSPGICLMAGSTSLVFAGTVEGRGEGTVILVNEASGRDGIGLKGRP